MVEITLICPLSPLSKVAIMILTQEVIFPRTLFFNHFLFLVQIILLANFNILTIFKQ